MRDIRRLFKFYSSFWASFSNMCVSSNLSLSCKLPNIFCQVINNTTFLFLMSVGSEVMLPPLIPDIGNLSLSSFVVDQSS